VIHGLLRFHAWIGGALALIAGLTWSTRVAAGRDTYGYVSQADLWLRGDLHIDQSLGADVPWPNARWTFTPIVAANAVARVDCTPLVSFRGGAVKMYDAMKRDRAGTPVRQAESRPSRECPPPRPAPRLR
jgi:hypothetical protein